MKTMLKALCVSSLLLIACIGCAEVDSSAQPAAPETVKYWEIEWHARDGVHTYSASWVSSSAGYVCWDDLETGLRRYLYAENILVIEKQKQK